MPTRTILASNDSTGIKDRTGIQSALNAGFDVALISGSTYYLDQAITIPSNRRIVASAPGQRAKITRAATWLPNPLLADSSTNSVFRIRGASIAGVATTTTATVNMGTSTLPVASAANIAIGSWLLVSGPNNVDPFYGQSDTITYSSMVKVSSAYAGGLNLPLQERLFNHHQATTPVTSIQPVENVEICDLEFDFSTPTANPVAVAIEGYLARNISLRNVRANGFSRACFEWDTCEFVSEESCSTRGLVNCLSLRQRSYCIRSNNLDWNGELGREHPLGIPQPVISDKLACTLCTATNGRVKKADALLREWGNVLCGADGFEVSDLYSAEMQLRDPDIYTQGDVHGILFDGGGRIVPTNASFGFGTFFTNIRGHNIFQLGLVGGFAIYWHDHIDSFIANIVVENKGNGPGTAGSYLRGLCVSDASGIVDGIMLNGVTWAIEFTNVFCQANMNGVYLQAKAGDGSNGGYAILMRYSGGTGLGPKIQDVQMLSQNGPLTYFDGPFAANPDRIAFIDRLNWDETQNWGELYPASCNYAASRGQVVEWTAAGVPTDVIQATAPGERALVSFEVPTNGWTWVAMGDACPTISGATPARGDLLEASAASPGTASRWTGGANNHGFLRVVRTAAAGSAAVCKRAFG